MEGQNWPILLEQYRKLIISDPYIPCLPYKPGLFSVLFDAIINMEFERRHGGHHHKANIKYGYIIFGISLFSALVLTVSNYVYLNKWLKNGSPNRRSVWSRLGSPQPLWLHVTLWLVITIGLSLFNIHEFRENYTTFIKRIGRLGFYMVPFDILLAIRPSLMATSYLEYIALHKWILRLILFLVSVHGIGFFVKWFLTDDVWTNSIKPLNFLGVVVFLLGLILAIVSLRPIRCRIYKVFYLLHNITIGSFLVLIFWHARPGVTDAVIISACLVTFQLIQRIRNCHLVSEISISDKKFSNLRLLRVPKPGNLPSLWEPGAHVRIAYPLTNPRSWLFPSHPFTVFSLPNDKTLDLVVKKSHKFQVQRSDDYTISNPYSSIPPAFFQTAERVVILCGGSGISLGIPVFRILSSNASVHSELHWVVSNKADSFILDNLELNNEANVYVTGNHSSTPHEDEDYEPDHALLSTGDEYELETLSGDTFQQPETKDGSYKKPDGNTRDFIKYQSGRPVLDNIFSSLLEATDTLNSWIVVCGPKSLINNAKKWGVDHDIQVFLEYYDF